LWAVILYGITLRNQYNLDDNIIVEKNTLVQQGVKAIPEILKSRYVVSNNRTYAYRPIPKIIFAIEYSVFGENLPVFHLTNLLLFILVIVSVYLFFKKLIGDEYKQVLFWGLLLFISYPANTEVVASLKNIDILLSLFFSISAFRFFLLFIDSKRWYFLIFVPILFLLAVLSKLDAILNFAIFSLGVLFFRKSFARNLIIAASILLIAFLTYKAFNRLLLPTQFRAVNFIENPLVANDSFIIRIATGFWAMLFYIKKLFLPYPLSIYYGYNIFDIHKISDISVIISISIIFLILSLSIYYNKKQKLISYFGLAFIGALLFFSNIFSKYPGGVADRYLFQISLMFFPFLLALISYRKSSKTFVFSKSLIILILFVVFGFGGFTMHRNTIWYNKEKLYTYDVKYNPNSAFLNRLYALEITSKVNHSVKVNGLTLDNRDSIKTAANYYKKALSIYKKDFTSNYSLGLINLIYYKKETEAIKYFKDAADLDLQDEDVNERKTLYYQLATLLQKNNRYGESINYLKKLVDLDKNLEKAYELLLKAELKIGNLQEAITTNKTMIDNKIGFEIPYVNIGIIYLQQGDTINSLIYYEQAAKVNPKNKDLIFRLLEYYKFKKDDEKIEYYSKIYSNLE